MASGDPLYFGRRYKLLIEPPGGKGKFEKEFEVKPGLPAMDIKFDCKYARGQTAREGSVSILGLGHAHIYELLRLSSITRGEAMSKKIRVRLDAGYFTDAGMINIIDGYAWYASITSPPQMWLNIKVSEYNPTGGKTVNLGTPSPDTMKNIIKSALVKFSDAEGVPIKLADHTYNQIVEKSTERKTPDFGKEGITMQEFITRLSELDKDVTFTIRSDRRGNKILEALDTNNELATRGEVKVDKDNGLLSVTGIDAVNGCVTTFLDGRYGDELSHLVLKSKLNPQANGKYYICKKQYVGHFMGQEWYTRYFCTGKQQPKK